MTHPFSKTFWSCILLPSEKPEKAHLDFPSIKRKRGHRGRQHSSCSDAERSWRRPLKKQQEVPLCSFSHAQEQLPQVPPAFDAAMRFAGQSQRQHVGDSDADLSTFEILQGSQGNGSQALWVLLAEAANAKAEDGLLRSLQRVARLRD